MKTQPGDILLAMKAIGLCSELRNNDRAVAVALIDHFNRQTGQCDPGLKRLAGLLGVSERTIMRSVDRIEAARLFRRTRHGGHLNRNSYEPNWSRLREIESAWSARMRSKPASRAEMSPTSSQSCHVPGDTAVTQTFRRNLSKETSQEGQPKKERSQGSSFARHRAARHSTPSAAAARTEAERRWQNDLHRGFSHMPVTYGEIIEALDAEIQASATDAELRSPGAGMTYIASRLKLAGGRFGASGR